MYILIIVQTIMAAFAGVLSASALSAYAAESYPYDETAIEDDLDALGAEIPAVSVAGEDVQVIALGEFAFAEDPADCEHYALYVYVYDRAANSYSTMAGENAVNMAVSYDADGEPDGYANLDLVYCSRTDDKTVWKYRVVDEAGQVLANVQAQDAENGKRRYDVAGVQLREVGAAMAQDHYVGKTFYYEGYAEGMSGESALSSTLTVNNTKTVSLDVEHAFYRPEHADLSTCDSLASVYFAIPNEYIEEYGELYAVHAEYLKAITDYIFVTGEQAVYDELSQHVGEDLSGLDLQYGFNVGKRNPDPILDPDFTELINGGFLEYSTTFIYTHSYNMQRETNGIFKHYTRDAMNTLHYIFFSGSEKADNYTVSTNELNEYMLNYSAGKSDLVLGRYARELFSEVDEKKTQLYLSADDTLPITSVDFTSFWESIFGSIYDRETYDVSAIQRVEKVENADQVQEDYYIDTSCYNDFASYYNEHKADSTVYVFHFAVDDYYSERGMNVNNDSNMSYEMNDNAYLAQEAVYLDFDIIDISMNDGEKVTVLGVASDPIDIISSITPPPEDPGVWWVVAIVIAAVLVILLVIVQIVRNQSGGKAK